MTTAAPHKAQLDTRIRLSFATNKQTNIQALYLLEQLIFIGLLVFLARQCFFLVTLWVKTILMAGNTECTEIKISR